MMRSWHWTEWAAPTWYLGIARNEEGWEIHLGRHILCLYAEDGPCAR